MDRLAQVGGVLGCEPLLFVFTQAAKLVLGNVSSILSWVADWVLVAEVDVLEACVNAFHL